MSSAARSDRASSQSGKSGKSDKSATSREDGQRPPKEEPDFVNERDLPTEDEPRKGPRANERANKAPAERANERANERAPQADVAGVESAAGEEDPGAALDAPPTPRSPA
jgi:hypothetical protein